MGALANTRRALRAGVLAVLALEALVPAAHFTYTRHAPDAHGATTHVARCGHTAATAAREPDARTAAVVAAGDAGATHDPATLVAGTCAELHTELCALAAALQSGLAARPPALAGPSAKPPLVGPPRRAPPRAVALAPYRLAPKTSPPTA